MQIFKVFEKGIVKSMISEVGSLGILQKSMWRFWTWNNHSQKWNWGREISIFSKSCIKCINVSKKFKIVNTKWTKLAPHSPIQRQNIGYLHT